MEGFSIKMKNAKGGTISLSELGISKKHFPTGAAAVIFVKDSILPEIFENDLDVAEIEVFDEDFEETYSHIRPEQEKKYQQQYACQKQLRSMLEEVLLKVDGNWNANNILEDLVSAEKFVDEKIYAEGIFY